MKPCIMNSELGRNSFTPTLAPRSTATARERRGCGRRASVIGGAFYRDVPPDDDSSALTLIPGVQPGPRLHTVSRLAPPLASVRES